jgi:peptidoglycan/LPS O-acetylase OafA/YrhL
MGYFTLFAGWTGVLIFFVLSGFLITGILYDNRGELHRFRNFYVRRTLRIFPLFYFAWLLVLVTSLLLHATWHPLQILWVVYLGNYVRFLVSDLRLDHIFTAHSNLPLEIGHFWSLAVEEQFYLIWPLVVFHVRTRKTLLRICGSTMIAVLMLRIVLWATVPDRLLSLEFLYRLTFTQCDAFMLGGLMALWMRGPEKDALLRHSSKILSASLASFALAYGFNNGFHVRYLLDTSAWMSTYGFTLVDCCAAGLILCALRPGSLVFRSTALLPLRVLGRYSYGFYVYHVLLMPFLHFYVLPVNPLAPKLAYRLHLAVSTSVDFVIILAVSACSYHFIEAPFLAMKERFTVRHKNPGTQQVALSTRTLAG